MGGKSDRPRAWPTAGAGQRADRDADDYARIRNSQLAAPASLKFEHRLRVSFEAHAGLGRENGTANAKSALMSRMILGAATNTV